ncbi:MAG: deoxyribodipyrimidine photo-lyase [Actinobacteria bacterium]|nr:deoxyribodipyrimidine photo-lyase [Actinomycetota bacterium]
MAVEPHGAGDVTASVVWFRRDLRLADNEALSRAAGDGPVVPLFVLDPLFFAKSGAPRVAFLLRSLAALNDSMNGALVVRSGDPAVVVPQVAAEANARAVFAAADFAPYGARRDAQVAGALARDGRSLVHAGSNYAVPPGTVRKGDGTPYAVFTPFFKAWQLVGWPAPFEAPAVRWHRLPSEPLPAEPPCGAALPPAGEDAVDARWDDFASRALDRYYDDRNAPGIDGCSMLSPYLRFGTVHPRTLLAGLDDSKSQHHYRSELCWREFYADVLHHHPDSSWRNLQRRMDRMEVDSGPRAEARFAAWCRGETGYPIVDAGMRQLLALGWMHNRVRMITASFLVKDLHLPWQWGARHFMRHLVDGDLASNSHGWQWTAGTGTDAAPYFRIFNPVMQGVRYDPDGAFVRRWIPELADVPAPAVHEPWTLGLMNPYREPIVDHAVERGISLARYKATAD